MTSQNESIDLQDGVWKISEELRRTSPWIFFFGVVGLMTGILSLILSAVVLVVNLTDVTGGSMAGYVTGVVLMVGAAIWIYPATKMISICTNIKTFRTSQNHHDLMNVVSGNNSLWRIAAVVTAALAGINLIAYAVNFLK